MELSLCRGGSTVQGLERGQDSALCQRLLAARPERSLQPRRRQMRRRLRLAAGEPALADSRDGRRWQPMPQRSGSLPKSTCLDGS